MDAGCPEGARNVATSHYYGIGVDKNATEAAAMFRKCSEDDLTCAGFLGLLHYNGEAVDYNPTAAVEWCVRGVPRGPG